MKSGLDHLPVNKQRELERVVQLVFEEFEDAFALASHEWKKKGRVLKIVLYGSYARGGWVDEPHTAKGYKSDYDLLIVVNDNRLTDRVKYWAKVDERLMREYGIAGTLRTPVNFIVHTLGEVNEGLAQGRYFFIDVARDGIALYQSEDTEFPEPRPQTPGQALALAKEYFDEWFSNSTKRFESAKFLMEKSYSKQAAFDLHQTTESLYHCALLVVQNYAPHSHNIGFLRTQAERLDGRLTFVWPRDNRKHRAMFEKLREAYVKARYSKHFRICEEELNWLAKRVEVLGRVVQEICSERIAQLETEVANVA